MSYLGLDIGTTGAKAGLFRGDGQLSALAYREYSLKSPEPGWAELDSERVCAACLDAMGEAVAACPADPVRALSISSQGEAFTPVDSEGNILAGAMVSSDARAVPLIDPWCERFGRKRLYELTGHTPHPMFSLFKLLWLKEHRPEAWSKAARFLCFEELMQTRLGIEPAISWPLAGRTMLFDVRAHAWAPEILETVGLEPERLAPPVPSGSVVGTIPSEVARRLGLPEGVQVVAGGHDQPCGALGAGVVEPGRAMYATGTVECICPAFNRLLLEDNLFQNNLCTYDYTLEGLYTTVLFSLTGGNLLKWFRDQWGGIEMAKAELQSEDPYELLLETMDSEPTDLLALPYFTPSGTPYFDAKVPGALLGLRLNTTRGQVLRGLLEGVALEMRLNVDILQQAGLAIEEFRAIGGGAKNPALTQLKADVLGRPITTLAVTEAGCLGVAMLACAADTGTPAGELAASWVKPQSVVEPHSRRAARYDHQFQAYKEVYPFLRDFYWRVDGNGTAG